MTDISLQPADLENAADMQALKHKASAAKEAVADLAGEAKRYASHRVQDAKVKAAGWMQSAKDKATDYKECTIDYVERNPYKALAIAAGIGFVAGLMLKRR